MFHYGLLLLVGRDMYVLHKKRLSRGERLAGLPHRMDFLGAVE